MEGNRTGKGNGRLAQHLCVKPACLDTVRPCLRAASLDVVRLDPICLVLLCLGPTWGKQRGRGNGKRNFNRKEKAKGREYIYIYIYICIYIYIGSLPKSAGLCMALCCAPLPCTRSTLVPLGGRTRPAHKGKSLCRQVGAHKVDPCAVSCPCAQGRAQGAQEGAQAAHKTTHKDHQSLCTHPLLATTVCETLCRHPPFSLCRGHWARTLCRAQAAIYIYICNIYIYIIMCLHIHTERA